MVILVKYNIFVNMVPLQTFMRFPPPAVNSLHKLQWLPFIYSYSGKRNKVRRKQHKVNFIGRTLNTSFCKSMVA